MRLEKIFIKNFRSIDEEGLEITFTNNHTIFVGENNVGKSSIVEAIKKALNFNADWDIEDWHLGDRNKTIEINITFVLDENQIKEIISLFGLPITPSEFKENFTNKLNCKFEKRLNQSFLTFGFKNFYIKGNTGWFDEIDRSKYLSTVDWRDEIIEEIIKKEGKITFEKIKETFEKYRPIRGNILIAFAYDISQELLRILRQKIIFIEEFRERPQNTLVEFFTSPTGKELASVLFNLKNSRQKAKFEQIQKFFRELFPNLNLDVIKENNEIKIFIQKFGIGSTTFFIGSGILESILLLTHAIVHNDKILCLDHPELHLHPHTQRLLASFIETTKDSQIIVITHSPYFVTLDKDTDVIRVFQKTIQTKIVQLPQDYFQDNEYAKLSQFLDIDSKELFFARKVVLVEGPTEIGALPVFASGIYSFDENGITVINVGGKNNFEFFAKLCEGFKIPYLMVADKNANSTITKITETYRTAKSYILPNEFEDIFPSELIDEAKRSVGEKSKPRIGRYVANRLKELGKIPEEIKQIIDEVKNL